MLIRDVMTRDVLCVSAQTSVMDAVALMNREKASCLVVSEKNRPVGMFTLRDVVHLARTGRAPSQPEISNWMGKPVLCIGADADIDEAYERLKSHHLRHLVVTDTDGEMMGVVSRIDIVYNLEPEYFTELKDISSIMCRNLATMQEGDRVRTAVEKMAGGSISCIVVEKDGRPAGILSEKDVAKLFGEGCDLAARTLAGVMSRPVLTVGMHASILDAVQLMREKKCRRLVVVDKKGRLAGLITQSSVIALMEDHYVESLKRVIRLRERTIQQHLEDTKALSAMVERLHQTGSIRDVYAIAMDGAMQVLHADRAGIYMFDADGVIRCQACQGLSEDYTHAVEGHSPWPQADTGAAPVYMADARQADLPDELYAVIRDEGIRAAAFLPLRGETQLFGKLMVYYNRPHTFSDDECQLGRVLAGNLATAVHRLQERNKLQVSRDESQQRADEWQHTFDAVDDTILLVDGEGRILRANGAAARLCGCEAPLPGKYCYEVLHHRDSPLEDCAHCVARLQGKVSSREMYEDHSGSWRMLSAYPVNANADGTYNAVIVTRDITERKRAEVLLRGEKHVLDQLSKGGSLTETLDILNRMVESLLPGARSTASTLDDQTRKLHMVSAPGFPASFVEGVDRTGIETCTQACFNDAHRHSISLVRDIAASKHCRACKDFVLTEGMTTCWTAPIVNAKEEVLGSLNIFYQECRQPTETDQELLKVVSRIGGVAIERMLAAEALRASEERYHSLVDTIPDAIVVHCNGEIVYANPAAASLFGAPGPDALLGRQALDLVPEEYRDTVVRRTQAVLQGGQTAPLIEERLLRLDGQMIDAEVTALPATSQGEPAVQVVLRDIAERKRAEAKLQRMAYHDTLTDLPNRVLLFDRLDQALAQAHRREQIFAVLFLDLDDFKDVNDALGHNAGDALLRQVGNRLRTCVRKVDTVARMGGDEFTCILTDVSDAKAAALVAEKVLADLSRPFLLAGGEERQVGCSVGIAIFPGHGGDRDTLISHADTAMYTAKRGGKNQYRFYQEEKGVRNLIRGR